MAKVYIAIGSNIDPEKNIPAALEALNSRCRVTALSRFYRSRPLNRPEQDDFINGACLIETELAPRELKFGVLRAIEEALGRIRTADTYAARTIDLDIALYGDEVIEEDGIVVPDPDILERSFLFLPLLDLDEEIVIPGSSGLLREQVETGVHDGVSMDGEFAAALREFVEK